MGFSHVQGNRANVTTASSSWSVTPLTSNPAQGDLVVLFIYVTNFNSGLTLSVKDSNNNSYQLTTSSPYGDTTNGNGTFSLAYLLSAPSNATKTINITWTGGSATGNVWADEFSYTGGSAAFDLDATGSTTATGSAFNNVSITPSGSGELLYAGASCSSVLTAPTAGATQGIWTGAGGGPDSSGTGGDAEYDLSSASGSSSVNFTCANSGDTTTAIIGAWKLIASTPTMDWTPPEESAAKVQAQGFYYDDDTYGPNVAGWPGIGTLLAIPKTFEMDCDTTSRNCDFNTAFMREPEGELPTLTWSGGVNSNAVPPPLLPELDCDTVSRNLDFNNADDQVPEVDLPPLPVLLYNSTAMPFEWDGADQSHNLDQFLSRMQVLDDCDKTPQNFFPIVDWTAPSEGTDRNLDVNVADKQVLDDTDTTPQPFLPTHVRDWSADELWQMWRADGVAQRSPYNPAVFEDYYNPANYFPLFGWDEIDWQHSTDSRVVEDEDEREIVWPIPIPTLAPNVGHDQDADESRWFDKWVVADEDAPTARAFSPTMDWTSDYDWTQSRDTRVVEDEDERELAWPIPTTGFSLWMDWTNEGEQLVAQTFAFQSLRLFYEEDPPASRAFSPTMDWTSDYDWAQSRDTRVVEDEDDLAPTPQNFFPMFGWDDTDVAQGWHFNPAVLTYDEDEREIAYPVPLPPGVLNLGWDQDGHESRWFAGSAGILPASDEDRDARPFHPTMPVDDWDVAQGSQYNPAACNFAELVEDDRSLQAITLQLAAMSLQQMLNVPFMALDQMLAVNFMDLDGMNNDT
jgi:hypothetical protein